MVDLGTFGGLWSYPSDINDSGQVVGYAHHVDGQNISADRAFIWSESEGLKQLGTLGGYSSYARAINATGYVGGSSAVADDAAIHPFIWTQEGGIVDLGALGVPENSGSADRLNNLGQAVGSSNNHLFIWTAVDGLQDLGQPPLPYREVQATGLNESSRLVGNFGGGSSDPPLAFTWAPGSGIATLPGLGGGSSSAQAINDRAEIAGSSWASDGRLYATLWRPIGPTTVAGADVTTTLVDPDTGITTTVQFDAVSSPGQTSVTVSSDGPELPAGFSLGSPEVYFDITTTASATPPFTVCVSYAAIEFPDPSTIRLLHYENGAWADVTSTVDALNQRVCGETSSLSPFALAARSSVYAFTGFFAPVVNPPATNMIKAGSAVPLKFSLGGDQGLSIFAPGYPASQQVACDTGSTLVDFNVTATAGSNSLVYDRTSQRYNYVWKTDPAWQGTCRRLVIRLNDDTEHVALFQFK
jgi:probable HAF family extracellular repeat protein